MARGGQTRDELTDAGRKMMKAMAKLKGRPYVKVGFPTAAFAKQRKEDKTVTQKQLVKSLLRDLGADIKVGEPLTVGEIAVLNEFGTFTIPERSFLRSTHDANQKEWWEATKKLKLKILLLQVSVKQGLGFLGEIIKRDIQATIRKGGVPYTPNAPSTIRQKTRNGKKGDKPLIDTAQMLNAVTYERVGAD